ncbi:MAG: SAF domain-containing protein [Actinomycetota bacterium]|nr:SAF domain-containing protein [Actinomycetota bacterium]
MATATELRQASNQNDIRLRPPGARQRQLPWVVVGIVCIVGGALAGGLWAASVSDRQPVLVMARAVSAGQPIRSPDLKVARVAGDGELRAIAAKDERTVVGQPAAVDLVAGTLLTRDHLVAGAGVGSSKAVVGLALKPGQLPSTKLGPGNQVQVVDTGTAPGTTGRANPTVLGTARVASVDNVQSDVAGETVVVSLTVERSEAPAVAAAGAAGRATLVLVS